MGPRGYLNTFLENYHINNYPNIHSCMQPSIHRPIHPHIYSPFPPSILLSTPHLLIHLFIRPSIYLSTHPFILVYTHRKHLPCVSPLPCAAEYTKMIRTWSLLLDLQIQTITRSCKAKWNISSVIRDVITGL